MVDARKNTAAARAALARRRQRALESLSSRTPAPLSPTRQSSLSSSVVAAINSPLPPSLSADGGDQGSYSSLSSYATNNTTTTSHTATNTTTRRPSVPSIDQKLPTSSSSQQEDIIRQQLQQTKLQKQSPPPSPRTTTQQQQQQQQQLKQQSNSVNGNNERTKLTSITKVTVEEKKQESFLHTITGGKRNTITNNTARNNVGMTPPIDNTNTTTHDASSPLRPFTALLSSVSKRLPPSSATAKLMSRTINNHTTTTTSAPSTSLPRTIGGGSIPRNKSSRAGVTPLSKSSSTTNPYYTTPSTLTMQPQKPQHITTRSNSHEISSEISSTTSLSSYERRNRIVQLMQQTQSNTPLAPPTPSTNPPTPSTTTRTHPTTPSTTTARESSLSIPSSPATTTQGLDYDAYNNNNMVDTHNDSHENNNNNNNNNFGNDNVVEPNEKNKEETLGENSLEEEPTVPAEGETLDGTCLNYESSITIQSLESTSYCVAASTSDTHDTTTTTTSTSLPQFHTKHKYHAIASMLTGSNTAMETFRIIPAAATPPPPTPPIAPADQQEHYVDKNHDSLAEMLNKEESPQPIRYGDTVALVSSLAHDCALGVKKHRLQPRNEEYQHIMENDPTFHYELGFFRSRVVLGAADKWTILSGEMDRIISVGTYAVEKLKHKRRQEPPPKLTSAAVRSGDCILLRNESTGGLLSFEHTKMTLHHQDDDYPTSLSSSIAKPILTLVTDSYESDPVHDKSSDNIQQHQSLLGRIQSHGQIRPKPNNIFRLIHASVPPCPPWTSSSISPSVTTSLSLKNNGGYYRRRRQRPYLDGTYLLHSERHKTSTNFNDETISIFFGGNMNNDPMIKAPSTADSNTHYSVKEQERILIDEVLGAMIGLEGRYIQFCGCHQNTNNDASTSLKTMDTSEFRINRQPAAQGNSGTATESPTKNISLDLGLSNVVSKMLPLPTAYVRVRAFVSAHIPGYEYGTVMQALCEALDYSLQEYLDFCLQMSELYRQSTNSALDLTLNQLYVHVKPALDTMSILQRVIQVAAPHKGGALLNSLHSLLLHDYAGDEQGQRALEFLLEKASIPYMNMLNTWLNAGLLNDPYSEFMVVKSPEESNQSDRGFGCDGDDWRVLYHIREKHVLQNGLSDQSVKHQILTTGKYWNAVRDCQKSDEVSQVGTSTEHMDANEVVSTILYNMNFVTAKVQIEQVYRRASGALLRVLLQDFKLMQSLQTLKRYFLLDQGDFLVHFLDAAEEDLLHELEHVSRGRIQYLLATSVQLTEQYEDDDEAIIGSQGQFALCPLTAQSIRCAFSSESLIDHLDALHAASGGIKVQDSRTPSRQAYGLANKGLTGIEAFMLHLPAISFPTSLVISERSLASYQLLFRHLFFAKHVERRLVNIWLDHQMMKELQSLRKALGPTYCLRQRMLHFMQNLIYYMMYEVIEPNWLELETAIRVGEESVHDKQQSQYGTKTVDDILDAHDEFLRRSLEECLLTDPELIATLTKLMSTCLLFSDQMKRFMAKTKIFEEKTSLNLEKQRMQQKCLIDPETMQTNRTLRKNLVAIRDERRNRLARQTARVERELTNESYKRMISRYDEVFNDNLGEFMMQLKEGRRQNWHGENLFLRLDYNGYVTRSMSMN